MVKVLGFALYYCKSKMKTTEEIKQLKDLIIYFHREGICPKVSALFNLFDGRAKGYLFAMDDLGQIVVEEGKIVLTN